MAGIHDAARRRRRRFRRNEERQLAEISTLGKYEVRREIGRGAMGVVYEGYDPQIKRVIALKTIRPDQLQGGDPATVIARFRREAQAAGRLSHPNIVAIHDFGEDAGVWYIAMELVKGRELKEAFEANERFRADDIVRIMTQILAALDYAHRQGVIHRDIKPANIFLLDDGTVKVADFGIAHIDSSSLTQVGAVLGTPSYMSPEQIQGLPVDGRSDLFSAGVVLYQFLTGERPFAGSAATTMQKVLKEEPLAPSALNVQVLPLMDAVVRRALAKRADDRFQTAQEFADAIRAAAPAAGLAAASRRVSDADPTIIARRTRRRPVPAPPAATAAPAVSASTAVAARSPESAAAKSSSPVAAIVLGVAIVAVAVGAWWHAAAAAGRRSRRPRSLRPRRWRYRGAPAGARRRHRPGARRHPRRGAGRPGGEPGTMTISAVGLVDPSDPRYPDRQGAAAERRCAPIRAASSSRRPSACWSTRSRSRRTTTCCRAGCSPTAATTSGPWSARASRAWARTA